MTIKLTIILVDIMIEPKYQQAKQIIKRSLWEMYANSFIKEVPSMMPLIHVHKLWFKIPSPRS